MLSEAQLEQRRANVAKIAAARRGATHCKRGHEFTPQNTYRKSNGTRQCLTCTTDNRWYHARGLTPPSW